jgi:predicted MFS family arabinose efflux permease
MMSLIDGVHAWQYAEVVEHEVALLETAAGLGASLGPLLGGVLYELLGMEIAFLVGAYSETCSLTHAPERPCAT